MIIIIHGLLCQIYSLMTSVIYELKMYLLAELFQFSKDVGTCLGHYFEFINNKLEQIYSMP